MTGVTVSPVRRRLHRLRIAVALAIAVAAPIWLVVAVVNGGFWIMPAVLTGQVAYYLARGFIEGWHHARRDGMAERLRMQERLAQECVRVAGGFDWPSPDKPEQIKAYGFPSNTVHIIR